MSVADSQVPGIYRRRVGDVLVTVLNDGGLELPLEVLLGIAPAEAESLLRAAGRRPPYTAAVNAFLLQWPDRTVLLDAGGGTAVGPTCGKLPASLRAAGVAPADIDHVVLTHMHSDHIGGLLDGTTPAFPKAELWVAEPEVAWWEDDATKAAFPEEHRGMIDLARRSIAAYPALHRFPAGPLLPGLEALPLAGHTPGHTGFLLTSGADRLLIASDIFHFPDVQSVRPEISVAFDTDPALAAKSRRSVLDRAVHEDLLLAGMHLSFPAFVRVSQIGEGFTLHPEPWRPDLA